MRTGGMRQPTSQADCDAHFARLAEHLPSRLLDTSTGAKRVAAVDEFMLMGVGQDGTAAFKHRDSRNYVYVVFSNRLTGESFLRVPKTDEAFHGGTFDVFDDVLAA